MLRRGLTSTLTTKATSAGATAVANMRSQLVLKRGLAFIIPGDDDALQKVAAAAEKKIYYFTASWCPPCKKIAPIFESLSKEHASIQFVKIDVDQFGGMAQEYAVRSVPTFFFMNGAEVVSEFSGAADALLKKGIEDLEKA